MPSEISVKYTLQLIFSVVAGYFSVFHLVVKESMSFLRGLRFSRWDDSFRSIDFFTDPGLGVLDLRGKLWVSQVLTQNVRAECLFLFCLNLESFPLSSKDSLFGWFFSVLLFSYILSTWAFSKWQLGNRQGRCFVLFSGKDRSGLAEFDILGHFY